MVSKNKLNIGIIGFGYMGQKYCRELLKSPLWNIAYICDLSAEARRIASEMVPTVRVISDEREIFDDPSVDVCGLFAFADSRFELIRKGLAANKHLLLEKPVAETIQAEWKAVRMIEASGNMVAVNMFNRCAWYHKTIMDFISDGEIGDLAIIRICHMTPGHMPQEGHGPEGPAFHDCGMHYVDAARMYSGSEYKTFHALGIRMWSHTDPWWVQVHGTFENGVAFDITQGFVYGHMAEKQTHNCYVDIIGTKGIARMTHDFKNATVELHGVTRTEKIVKNFGDKKLDVLVDVLARSIHAGRNLGFPEVRDSVIASEMSWKMLEDAVRNGAPCIGSPKEMDEIMARRRTMTNGYGLPVWKILDEKQPLKTT